MANPVLTRLLAQRDEQTQFISTLLERVEAEQRDLVEAERSNLQAVKQRITELDAQIAPLEEFEQVRAAHTSTVVASNPPAEDRSVPAGGTRLGVTPREQTYETAGHFMVDYVRSMDFPQEGLRGSADARQRISAALGRAAGDVAPGVHQTTEDTPGLLPRNIVGQVLNDLDAVRPFLSSIGVQDLAGIPGKNFDRPVITEHTKAGKQTAEKAEGVSGEVKIGSVAFTKETFLTWMNISRQDIDWTSPTAWNILIGDMIDAYAIATEDDAASKFAAAITQTQGMGTSPTIESIIKAMYAARTKAVTAGGTKRASAKRMPNTLWVSADMDDELGAIIDLHFATNFNGVGSAGVDSFGGNLLKLPRVMVPGFPAGTVILGRKELTEAYEQRLGVLQAVEPKVLGVQAAYGGYAAFGTLDPTAFTKITKTA